VDSSVNHPDLAEKPPTLGALLRKKRTPNFTNVT
jgi:hypothetical protein